MAVLLGRGLVAFRQLALVPFMLWAWETEYYGAWLVISSVPTFLSMSNLGLGSAATNQASLEFMAGRIDSAIGTVKLGIATTLSIGFICIPASALLIDIYFPGKFAILEHPIEIVLLLVSTLFVQLSTSILDAIWIGSGRATSAQSRNNVLQFLLLISTFILLWQRSSALVVALTNFLVTFLWMAIYAIRSLAVLKNIKRSPDDKRSWQYWPMFKNLLFKGIGFQMGSLWQAIYFQGSIIIAGYALGNSGAALWGSLRIATRSGNQLLELIGQTAAPEFQLTFARKEFSKLRKIYMAATKASVIAGMLITLTLLSIGLPLFNLWTQNNFQVSTPTWIVMCLALVPFSVWWNGAVLQRCLNRPWISNGYGIVSSTIAITCMYALGNKGVFYFAASSLIFEFLMLIFIFPHSLRLVKLYEGTAIPQNKNIGSS